MWSARGAYRNTEGQIVPLPERSPLWASKDGLVIQIMRDHQGAIHLHKSSIGEDWYRWMDEAGVERFVVIEDHR